MGKELCPHCGQVMRERRLGVFLTDTEARIFDHIRRGGSDGLATAALREITGMHTRHLQGRIVSINEKIADTGYRIVSVMHHWHLMKKDTQHEPIPMRSSVK